MCGTMTTQQYGGYMQIAGAATEAYGQYQLGNLKASMQEADAAAALATADTKAKRIRTAGREAIGNTRAGATAAGVSLNSQSVLMAEGQTVRNVEQDAMAAIITGGNQAFADRFSAGLYRQAGLNSATETLLTGGLQGWKGVSSKSSKAGGS